MAAMVSQGLNHRDIAKAIGRTQASVRKRCFELGFKSPLFHGKWTEGEIAWVLQNHMRVSCKEAAEHLGKSYTAVSLFLLKRKLKCASGIVNKWSGEQQRMLFKLTEEQKTNGEIAKMIGKTYGAVVARKRELGIREHWKVHQVTGKRFKARAWTREEFNQVLGRVEFRTVTRLAREMKRSPHSIVMKLRSKGVSPSQGRVTFKELATTINCSPTWLVRKAREIHIWARKYGGRGGMAIASVSSAEIVKLMDHILKNSGIGTFKIKKARELRDMHYDIDSAVA